MHPHPRYIVVKAGINGYRIGDELGIALAPSFRPYARPNCKQAGCSHSRKGRALVISHSYRMTEVRVHGTRLWMYPVGDRPPPLETIGSNTDKKIIFGEHKDRRM
jgi:hypothetical protein